MDLTSSSPLKGVEGKERSDVVPRSGRVEEVEEVEEVEGVKGGRGDEESRSQGTKLRNGETQFRAAEDAIPRIGKRKPVKPEIRL